MGKFLQSNEWQYRLLRTVIQGVIGVIIANLDLLVGQCVLDPQMRGFVVALVMAFLSPLMAMLGNGNGEHEEIEGGME